MSKMSKYMPIAQAIGALSKDRSTQVGAAILGKSMEIRAMGYNGAPRGCAADEDTRTLQRPEKYFWMSHAELNAITNAARVGTPLAGSTIVVTHFPCMDCARAIVQTGITKVVTHTPNLEFARRWADHITRAKALFAECGVELELLDPAVETESEGGEL